MINRRSLITGLISLVAAPAIIRVSSLMPVKNMMEESSLLGQYMIEPPVVKGQFRVTRYLEQIRIFVYDGDNWIEPFPYVV